MKALIFAAGLGTRLKPFTLSHPKALVEVGEEPMLAHVIHRMAHAGADTVVVNVHHFASQIVDFIATHDFGIPVIISDESDLLLDTGGGILKARRWLETDDRFIVHNADILTNFSLGDMLSNARQTEALATLLVDRRDTSRYLLFDQTHRMHGWLNTKTQEVRPSGINASELTPLAFGGVHIVSSNIFPLLSKYNEHINIAEGKIPGTLNKFSIIDFYINACTQAPIMGYTPNSQYMWHDVGKPESLEAARKAFKKAGN